MTVTGNEARPSTTFPSPSGAQCPDGDCPYAGAFGGGIATAGRLILVDATVSGNLAGGTASDANGGGIFSAVGPVDISGSTIAGNVAAPAPHAIGRWAEGGGITIGHGSRPTTIMNTKIETNVARLVTDWPVTVDMAAQSGGVYMEGNTQLTMTGSALTGNRVVAVAPSGQPLVVDAALHYQYGGDGLLLEDTTVTSNTLAARIATAEDLAPMGGVVEVDGHAVMRGVTISENHQTLHTTDGTAGLNGALFLCGCGNGDGGVTDLQDVTVSDNVSIATSEVGPAWVWGGGVDGARRHPPHVGSVADRPQPVCRHRPRRPQQGGGPRWWPLGRTVVGNRPDRRPHRVDRDRQQRHRVTRRRGARRRRIRRGAGVRHRWRDREHPDDVYLP